MPPLMQLPAYQATQVDPGNFFEPINNALMQYRRGMDEQAKHQLARDQFGLHKREVDARLDDRALAQQRYQTFMSNPANMADLPAGVRPFVGALGPEGLHYGLNALMQARNDDIERRKAEASIEHSRAGTATSMAQLQQLKMQTPEWRMANAHRFGIDASTPEGKQFVITGNYAPPSNKFVHFKEGETGGFVNERAGTFTPTTAGDTTEGRRAKLSEMGVDPNSHAGKVYLANGKLPQADPMTATDKKAVFEAEEQLQTARQSVENLKLALQESAKAYTGPTAGARGYISSIVGSPAGEATENLHNIVATNAVQSLKSIFGGNPTEGERKILLELAGSVNKAQSVRDEIYRRAIALAERRIDFNQQRVDQLRGGNYYQPQGGPQQPRPQAQPQAPEKSASPLDGWSYERLP